MRKQRIEQSADEIKLMSYMARLPKKTSDWLLENKFAFSPASTKYHGNYAGGLADHSVAFVDALVMLTNGLGLKWENPRSPFIIGLLHDVCKLNAYILLEDGTYDYNKEDALYAGHGSLSLQLLQPVIDLTEEEALCIRYHMGAYETAEWDYYDRAIKKYPNVLYSHTADMIASKIMGV